MDKINRLFCKVLYSKKTKKILGDLFIPKPRLRLKEYFAKTKKD